MKINNEYLQEFIKLYNKEFGYISQADAQEMASRLVDLYALLAEALPSEKELEATPPSEETGSLSPL